MAAAASDSLLLRSVRGAIYQLGEFVHVCAIYLGIAVLVTAVLSVALPSLRQQALRIHEALLIALRPDGYNQDLYAMFASDGGFVAAGDPAAGDLAAGDPARPDAAAGPTGSVPREDARAFENAELTSRSPAAAQLSFNNALKAAMAGRHVATLTSTQAQALRSYIARKYRIAHAVAGALVDTAFVVGTEKKLDPQLLLAVIAIESRYNPYAESHVGAQGLMQVMTSVHKDKFDAFSEGPIAALNPIANIRVGAHILQDCIRRRGSVESGLACYVGATGPSDGGYGAKVIAEWRRIALASGIPVGR